MRGERGWDLRGRATFQISPPGEEDPSRAIQDEEHVQTEVDEGGMGDVGLDVVGVAGRHVSVGLIPRRPVRQLAVKFSDIVEQDVAHPLDVLDSVAYFEGFEAGEEDEL